MERWVVAAKRADFQEIGKKFHIDQVLARLIRNRNQISMEEIETYLHGGLKDLHSPWLMKGVKEAVLLLEEKIKVRKSIRIIGDYDIDGVMSSFILFSTLRDLGAEVDVMIPHRMKDGYGINIDLVKAAKEDGIDTIITCDNGIAAREQIAFAKGMGMTVILTDHHEVPFEEVEGKKQYFLPEADVIINPKQEEDKYPFKELCGAGVAFKFMVAFCQQMGCQEKMQDLLEIVAFATIGDVMPLVGENRILVKEGLKAMEKSKNLGLKELIKVNQLEGAKLSPYHIGFILGPCMNASGRLDTALRSLKLLCADRQEEAASLAGDLKALNESRKEMTLKYTKEALELVETTNLKKDKVLVVYLAKCHESLAGIIAGRLKEAYQKPSFVITDDEEGNLKGSGRSIESYSMYEEISKAKDYLLKFGGHPMAAGLSMPKENLEKFRNFLNEHTKLSEEDFVEKVSVDMPLPLDYVTEELIQSFTLLEPFGRENTKPLFAERAVRVVHARLLGKNKNVVKMKIQNANGYIGEAVCFKDAEAFYERTKEGNLIDIVYYPEINDYQSRTSLQYVISHYRLNKQ
ncbi:MAG TPA: single-stranded-DNA-specific exonuclease RecJ [Lachnospiraceae bacterium]